MSQENFPRRSGFERVVGPTLEEEQKILGELAELFENKGELAKNEVPKTPEQREIVEFLVREVPKFAARYGARPLPIREHHVVFEKAGLLKRLADKIRNFLMVASMWACYEIGEQKVHCFVSKEDSSSSSLYILARNLAHEFLHFHSFQSGLYKKEKPKGIFSVRRVGLGISEKNYGERFYFNDLNEAVTDMLVDRFFKNEGVEIAKPEILIRAEIEQQKAKGLARDAGHEEMAKSAEAIVVKRARPDNFRAGFYYSVPGEKAKLTELIREIYEKNKSEFKSEEEVFSIFARAAMSGRLLSLARLIEKTFGKGSFRSLGQKTETRN